MMQCFEVNLPDQDLEGQTIDHEYFLQYSPRGAPLFLYFVCCFCPAAVPHWGWMCTRCFPTAPEPDQMSSITHLIDTAVTFSVCYLE